MASKLYVGGLSYGTTDQELEALFADHGKVVSVAIIKDRDSGQSKGFGFVEMENDPDAQAAIKALNDKEVGGRRIIVNVARPQEDRSSGGSYRASR
jgi:cold-inducible RNA-binding protein